MWRLQRTLGRTRKSKRKREINFRTRKSTKCRCSRWVIHVLELSKYKTLYVNGWTPKRSRSSRIKSTRFTKNLESNCSWEISYNWKKQLLFSKWIGRIFLWEVRESFNSRAKGSFTIITEPTNRIWRRLFYASCEYKLGRKNQLHHMPCFFRRFSSFSRSLTWLKSSKSSEQ